MLPSLLQGWPRWYILRPGQERAGVGSFRSGNIGGERAMGKTREQRAKELTKPSAVRAAWGAVNAKYKELNAPIFLKLGNIAGSAKDYDDATKAFLDAVKKKGETIKIFDECAKQKETVAKKFDGLNKELDSVKDDEKASLKTSGGTDPEDYLERLENLVKGQEDLNKARQSIQDNLMKTAESIVKLYVDAQDKMEKAINTANSDLDKANKDMDVAEQDIRKCVRAYYSTALDMNKKDMADAVNKLLTEFGK
jgi:hypothetical protein